MPHEDTFHIQALVSTKILANTKEAPGWRRRISMFERKYISTWPSGVEAERRVGQTSLGVLWKILPFRRYSVSQFEILGILSQIKIMNQDVSSSSLIALHRRFTFLLIGRLSCRNSCSKYAFAVWWI